MAQLLVRNLDEDLVAALKARAEARGRSVEEEHRRILRRALFPKKARQTLAEYLLTSFPQLDVPDDLFARDRTPDTRPVPFADEDK